MRRLLAEALEQGAVGLSTGLTYAPGHVRRRRRARRALRGAARHGGFYCPHHRNYGLRALEAYADCIEIVRRARRPAPPRARPLGFAVNRGRAPELLALIDAARARRDRRHARHLPVPRRRHVPARLPAGLGARRRARRGDRAASRRRRSASACASSWRRGLGRLPRRADRLGRSSSSAARDGRSTSASSGSSVAEAAAEAGERPIDFFCELLADEGLGVSCIAHIGNEENVRTIMTHPAHTAGATASSSASDPTRARCGTFPRYLAVYVRELGILRWEQAIRKMTSLPAQRLGFPDRGLLRPGMAARRRLLRPRDRARHRDLRGAAQPPGRDPLRRSSTDVSSSTTVGRRASCPAGRSGHGRADQVEPRTAA